MAIKFLSDTTHKKGDIHIDGNNSERLDLDSGVKITGQYNANNNTEYTYINMYNGGDASINIGTKHNLGYISFESGNGAYTERMRITNTGNVGIGTTSPTDYANSADNLVVQSSGDTGITIATTNTTKETNLYFADGNTGSDRFRGGFLYKHEDDSLRTLTNASEKMRITSAGNVGIGTTSPSKKLHVKGELGIERSDTTAVNTISSEGNFKFVADTGYAMTFTSQGSEMVRFYNGRVGIGTTSADSLLEISSSSTSDFLKLTSAGSGANPIKMIFEKSSTEQGVIEYNRNGDLELYNTDGDGGVLISGSASADPDLYVGHNSNVGIGTTSPASDLHIGNNDPVVQIGTLNTSTGNAALKMFSKNDGTGNSYFIQYTKGTGVDRLDFIDGGGTAKVSFKNGGNVGIGTTNPTEKLHIVTSGEDQVAKLYQATYQQFNFEYPATYTSSFEFGYLGNLEYNGNGGYLTLENKSTQTGSHIAIKTAGSERARITHDGKMGVGTSSPSGLMHIYNGDAGSTTVNTSHDDLIVENSGNVGIQLFGPATSYQYLAFGDPGAANAGYVRYDHTNNEMRFRTNGTDKVTIVSGGSVGIGTTSPDTKLHVSGNAKATNYYVNDQIIHNGDTDTYIKFDNNLIRIYAGGTKKFDSDVTYADQSNIVSYFKSITSQGNFLNTYDWSKDSSGSVDNGWADFGYPYNPTGSWGQNGGSSENTRSIETIPGGVGVVWQTPSNDANSDADGGWNITINNLEASKSYRSVVYFRKTDDSTSGTFYHGCGGSTGMTESLAGVAQSNPYFHTKGLSSFLQDRWYVSIGIIQAHQSSNDGTSSGWGGIYDCQTGKKIHSGSDFMMGENAVSQIHRTYQYYSTDTNSSCEWWGPRFEELNGNEPSIAELIAKGRTDHFTFHRNFDPTLLSELTENNDATDDKIFLWDESADQWKYMTLDNLQDSIDTTGGGTINNDDWSGTDLAIANGGTGASSASTARTNLGLGTAATAASTDFISSTADDTMGGKLTITGGLSEEDSLKTTNGRIQLGPQSNGAGIWFDRTSDDRYWFAGLSSSDGTSLRFYRGGDRFVLDSSGNLRLNNYGSGIAKFDGDGNITSGTINDGNWSGTDLAIANGGTGASTASAARTNLGLGTAATSASTDFVAVTGDSMTGNLSFNDSSEIRLGNGGDLKLYHDGTYSVIQSSTGELYIQNTSDDKDIILRSDDGSGGLSDYIRLDGSDTTVKVSKNFVFADSVHARFGSGQDLRIYHDATNSNIVNNNGTLQIIQNVDDGDITFLSDNGSGGTTEYFRVDGGEGRVVTSVNHRYVDDAQLMIGTGADLKLYHDGSNSYIDDTGTGGLYIKGSNFVTTQSASGENMIKAVADGQVELYHNNAKKFETTSTGVTVTGEITTTGGNSTNWQTAYGWGDHSTQNYITTSDVDDTPVDGATTAPISSNWAFDNVKTAVPSGAVFTDTTYSVGDDGLTEKNFTSALKTKLDGIAASADNYGNWKFVDNADASTEIRSGNYVKFDDATVTGAGTSGDPYVINIADNNTTYTAGGDYGLTLSGTQFRLENDRRRNSSTTDIYTGNTHDYTFYDADIGIRWYTAGAEEMRLENDGDLHVDGDVIAYSTTVSDARLKDDVQTIRNASAKVAQLRGVEYTWNEGSRKGQREIGVIAQEVEKVVPEIVHEKKLPFAGDEVYKTVDYEKMVALLIQSNKELQRRIETLEEKLDGITK